MHKNFRYDKAQIDILKRNKAKNYNAKTLANPHKEKLKIATLISSLDEDEPERHKYVLYLNDINKEIERRQSQRSQALKVSIASINEKNKILNKKLMLKAREKERKLAAKMKGKKKAKDPFTRAITAPQIESFNNAIFEDEEAKKKRLAEEKRKREEEEKKKKMKKVKKEEEDLKNLSILADHKRRMERQKKVKSLDNDNNNNNSNYNELLIKCPLWRSAIHSVAKDFVSTCRDIEISDVLNDEEIEMMIKEPQFGRNKNKSRYGWQHTLRPNEIRIITIDEYLQNEKFQQQ